MGIEELNFSSAVLQGSAFAGLADLVADLASQKDSGVTADPGLTFLEMQNLIKSFGFETMAKLGRERKVDASGQLFWALPLSEVKQLNVPVVIGTDIVTDVMADKDKNLPSGDNHFIDGLAKGYADIVANKTNNSAAPTTHSIIGNDGNPVETGNASLYFPRGRDLDAIDWFDLSSVVASENIRFDNRSATTDISAIHTLFKLGQTGQGVAANTKAISQDRLNDANEAKIGYNSKSNMELNYAERDRDFLNFIGLFDPMPNYKDVSSCGIATVVPYLENGLFTSNVGYGLNKEYLTLASDMRNKIRNNVRGSNTTEGANLVKEFQIMKEYGFPKSKAYNAYTKELSFGVNPNNGVEYSSTQPASTWATKTGSPSDIQAQFASVYGTTGELSDQLTDFKQDEVFNDTDGFTLENVKAATDVKSWVEYINRVKDFINSDPDYHWSEKGIAFPINKLGSKRETWENHQKVLLKDPRLSDLPNISLTSGQDERLRILLETIKNADSSGNLTALGIVTNDLSFSSYASNDMTLAIAYDISDAPVYVRNGVLMNGLDGGALNTNSIWVAAVKHGWSDATEVYGNLKGSGIFMMDNVYNIRSRIQKLDYESTPTTWDDNAPNRAKQFKNQTSLKLTGTGNRYAFEYFTPGHFQDAFFDMNNLQHTANVALRYFDLETRATIVDDVSRNVTSVDNVLSYQLPLKIMDKGPNTTPADYSDQAQHDRIGWVYNELVRKSFNNSKAAIAEITSWKPVPPQLFVDVQDLKDYKSPANRISEKISQNGDYVYNTAQANYDNRNLDGGMVHVMANYFAKAATGSNNNNKNKEADLITLLDLHPIETLLAFKKMSRNADATNSTLFTIQNKTGASRSLVSTHLDSGLANVILQALVHYGKPVSYFSAIGASAKTAIDAFETEVKAWASDMNNSMGVFGDDADVFSMVQHLGYWIPYLSQYSAAEIAEEAASDSDIQNISDEARALMLGLLLAASRGTLTSSKASDANARIAGLNAFHDAGIPKMLVDIAFTLRGINVFTNLTGSKYDA